MISGIEASYNITEERDFELFVESLLHFTPFVLQLEQGDDASHLIRLIRHRLQALETCFRFGRCFGGVAAGVSFPRSPNVLFVGTVKVLNILKTPVTFLDARSCMLMVEYITSGIMFQICKQRGVVWEPNQLIGVKLRKLLLDWRLKRSEGSLSSSCSGLILTIPENSFQYS